MIVFVGTSQIQCCHPFSDPGKCSHMQPEPDFKRHVRDQLHANIVTKYFAVSSERKPMSCLGKTVFRRNTKLMTATKYRGHVSPLHWYPISVKPEFRMALVRTRKALAPSSCCPSLSESTLDKASRKQRSSCTNSETGDFYYI